MVSVLCLLLIFMSMGCAQRPKQLMIKEVAASFPQGSIISAKTGSIVSFDAMMADLSGVPVVYIGESHTNTEHHEIQLRILTALFHHYSKPSVGMEMFARTYQAQLDAWSAGQLDETQFLKKTHWYANWRYDYGLYRAILDFVKTNHLPLLGLNLPFHIPPKISIGGIDSLSETEKKDLPEAVVLTDTEHREYLQEIFSLHRIPGRNEFEHFYEAQCAWEDTMAETVARHSQTAQIVVLAGNGHIYRKFGIPKRAFDRSRAEYRTVYLAEADGEIELAAADYIWVTAPSRNMFFRHRKHAEAAPR